MPFHKYLTDYLSGQCLAVLASYSFPTSQGPKFTKGITINIAFQGLGFILALAMSAYFRWENKRRDRVEGGRPNKDAALNVIEEFDLAPGKSGQSGLVGRILISYSYIGFRYTP